jgi:tetratricopeptide (TPR) repeat protein
MSSDNDGDANKLGGTLRRVGSFLGTIVSKGGQNNTNNSCNNSHGGDESYRDPENNGKDDNIYNCLRSVRLTNDGMWGGDHTSMVDGLDISDYHSLASVGGGDDSLDISIRSYIDDDHSHATPSSSIMSRRESQQRRYSDVSKLTTASSVENLASRKLTSRRLSSLASFSTGLHSSETTPLHAKSSFNSSFTKLTIGRLSSAIPTHAPAAQSYHPEEQPSLATSSFTDHHARSRTTFVRRNISMAASNADSFRDFQRLIKDKGAITGGAIQHMMLEAAEEHAVNAINYEYDGMGGALHSNDSSDYLFNPTANDNEGGEGSVNPQKTPRFDDVNDDCPDDAQHDAERQLRRNKDPMFGDTTRRSYINIPSRESSVETLIHHVRNAADHGESRLLTVHGRKFVGKTRLVNHVIDTVQGQGLGYKLYTSVRSAGDIFTSFYCFREIASAALRACDAVTESIDGSNNAEKVADNTLGESMKKDEDNDLKLILERLKRRKILNKSDQLMISRILPAVMDDQLLSLLGGRNPAALIKDIATSLFKILIPLQPLCFVFEADGEECNIDPSSWGLIEEMLLSAGTQCPQMLMIAISRHSLLDSIPPSLIERQVVSIHVEKMDRSDTVCFIRALFCDANIDRNMQVDPHVADAVYHRADGCPLFTERIILWSQRKDLIELDETRNAVALNIPTIDRIDRVNRCDLSIRGKDELLLLKTLPANLSEEILENINNLPHHLLDALKVASQIGTSFDVDEYASLCLQGFHNSLQELIVSHGIFDGKNDHCFRWRHIAVYEAVLSIIISNERFELHGRIADSLRDSSLSPIGKSDARYARHFELAERWGDAFDRYMEAGDQAEKKHDFAGAVGIYQQAKLCLTKARKNHSLQRRLSPHAALGLCFKELMRYEDAERELEFCLEQIMTVPEHRRNVEIELKVVTNLAVLKQSQSKYSEAMAMYERALPLARANKETHSQAWLAHHVASCAEIHRKAGDLLQAKTLHTEALAYRERAVNENDCTILDLAISFTQLGCTMSGLGDNSGAYNLHKKALAARVDHLDFYHSLVSESYVLACPFSK